MILPPSAVCSCTCTHTRTLRQSLGSYIYTRAADAKINKHSLARAAKYKCSGSQQNQINGKQPLMCLFADSSRLSLDEIFFFLLVFLLRLSIQRINSRFIFCSIFLLWSRSAQWQNEGIIWFRSNPYTQVFYSQCNYICTSPAVQGAALVSCCVLFPSFLLVSPSADPSGGCHVKNVVLRKGCGGGWLLHSGGLKSIFQLKDCILSES